ncbi:MAG TPA: type II toxin-antitoxin system prevent-host-death family antitoxin [Thermoanaerobaculia bacterium]|nr:type II toxin-antitoxin system prevent-host-death family antitoxin [Thermoanaerobaculia bacterium]
MNRTKRRGAEEARNQFSDLLAAAESGDSTIITKHGRAIAALVPADQHDPAGRQQSLLALRGSGRGMWGSRSAETIAALRDEWDR